MDLSINPVEEVAYDGDLGKEGFRDLLETIFAPECCFPCDERGFQESDRMGMFGSYQHRRPQKIFRGPGRADPITLDPVPQIWRRIGGDRKMLGS